MKSRNECNLLSINDPTEFCDHREYRSAIARKLLPLYNDSWRDGEVIGMEEFMRRIYLAEIRVSPVDFGSPGCAILYYANGDLFAGHSIEVFLDADFNYVKSQIAG
jgi:hypothetical protein